MLTTTKMISGRNTALDSSLAKIREALHTGTTAERNWKPSILQSLKQFKTITINDNAPTVDQDWKRAKLYQVVPKHPYHNLVFREKLLELAQDSEEARKEIWMACRRDILFFVNTFCWVFEPREARMYPFITWPIQDRTFLLFNRYIGKKDIGVEKSRDMGASWMFLTAFYYRWHFFENQAFGLVSRTEDAVDKKDDPDSLMWKLDFLYEKMPMWLRPNLYRIKRTFKNRDLNSVITGYSATQDVARGGRKLAFGMDEMSAWPIDDGNSAWASTQHVTFCRLAVSTPKGAAGIFADSMNSDSAAMLKISLHWTEHPDKVRGLYISKNGVLEILDDNYVYPPDYPFILDGKLRSPYYDNECRRHPIPALIAQELDINYGGSGYPFFSASMVEDHAKAFAQEPFQCGEMDYANKDEEPTYKHGGHGRLRLWCHLTADGTPPRGHDYVIGCDIATGVGGDQSTNSVASVVNRDTGEKVAEFSVNTMIPYDFCDYVIALRKWFRGPGGDAFIIWETNGPGLQFTKYLLDNSSHRLYYREADDRVAGKKSRQPGWRANRDTKAVLLGEYGKSLERGSFVNRSAVALDEMLHYVHYPNGAVDHDRAKSSLDPTAAGENHGDRVIADALASRAVRSSVEQKDNKKHTMKDPPIGSMAWRMKMRQQKPKESWL